MSIDTLKIYEKLLSSGVTPEAAHAQVEIMMEQSQQFVSSNDLKIMFDNMWLKIDNRFTVIEGEIKRLKNFDYFIVLGLFIMPLIFKLYDKLL